MTKKTANESGNILIYILGAIFLMGILVVAMRGSNTPGAGIDAENIIIKVTEVQKYGAELEQAVAYVLRNGHSEVDIRFAHPNAPSTYGDIVVDTPTTRQVFHSNGGAAEYRDPPSGIQTIVTPWLFNGRNIVEKVGTQCAADRCVDLVAILQNVSKNFCLLINEKNSITNPSGNPPADPGIFEVVTPFTGTFTFVNGIGDAAGDLSGHLEGCIEGGGTPPVGTYHYYRVLLAR